MIAQLRRIKPLVSTRKVIENYYTYSTPRDRIRWLALFHPDVVLDEVLVGKVEGIEELATTIALMDVAFPEFRAVPRHIVINGNEACVMEDISTVTAHRVPIQVRAACFFRLMDGKIIYCANVRDTAPLLKLQRTRVHSV